MQNTTPGREIKVIKLLLNLNSKQFILLKLGNKVRMLA